MEQFGQELRRERESRGIALESITASTKINPRHLHALEEENFGELPGGVLSKGVVRGYVRAVGLDEEDWVKRYLAACGGPGEGLEEEDKRWVVFAENVSRSRNGENARRAKRGRWAGVAVLLTLLALFSWYVVHFVSDGAVVKPAAAAAQSSAYGHPGQLRSGITPRLPGSAA